MIARTLEERATSPSCPAASRSSGHLPSMPVTSTSRGADVVVAVHGGFVEVSGDRVTILSDVAELPEHIDPGRAEAAKSAAEAAPLPDADSEDAKAALRRADTRLAVHQGRGLSGGTPGSGALGSTASPSLSSSPSRWRPSSTACGGPSSTAERLLVPPHLTLVSLVNLKDKDLLPPGPRQARVRPSRRLCAAPRPGDLLPPGHSHGAPRRRRGGLAGSARPPLGDRRRRPLDRPDLHQFVPHVTLQTVRRRIRRPSRRCRLAGGGHLRPGPRAVQGDHQVWKPFTEATLGPLAVVGRGGIELALHLGPPRTGGGRPARDRRRRRW